MQYVNAAVGEGFKSDLFQINTWFRLRDIAKVKAFILRNLGTRPGTTVPEKTALVVKGIICRLNLIVSVAPFSSA